MNSAQFQAFLKQSGSVFEVRKDSDNVSLFRFRDRGTEFSGISYEDDPAFLHLTLTVALAQKTDVALLDRVIRDVEAKYRVVKLRAFNDKDALLLEVSTEQFEPKLEAIETVLWRSLDLMKNAWSNCVFLLNVRCDGATVDSDNDTALLEEGLRKGAHMLGQVSDTAEHVKAAVGLIAVPDATGTTFCVKTTAHRSYFVTNAHVIGDAQEVFLYLQVPRFAKLKVRVEAKGSPEKVDLALLSVGASHAPILEVSKILPNCDSPVALAGYARVQLWAAERFGEVVPTIHVGTITAINCDGSQIMHDAISRPGNSGGPLFDPRTGTVVGVNTSGWADEEASLAIGASVLLAFLKDHLPNI
jgi:V8-like Glu-specific endopeptidase